MSIEQQVEDLETENRFLWRAIDILMQELGPSQFVSEWFRTEWVKLLDERKRWQDVVRDA